MDMGLIGKGAIEDPASVDKELMDLENEFLYRSGIGVITKGTVNEKLDVVVGVGGLFWKPFPEDETKASRIIQFGPGIVEASAQLNFSENLFLKLGYFEYKYNKNASNLGEYLLRPPFLVDPHLDVVQVVQVFQ